MMLAFITGFIALQAEIRRRRLEIDPHSVITAMALAGILGAKIWHIVDTPADRPTLDLIFSWGVLPWFQQGFAWFGALVPGTATLLFMARKYKISMSTMLAVPAAPYPPPYSLLRIHCP